MLHRFMLCVISVGALWCSGCGGSSGGYSGPWGQASGVVSLDGSPLSEEATVTFISAKGFTASGKVDSSGEFRLKCNGSNDIPVGSYSVGILPAIPVQATNQDPSSFFNEDGSSKETNEVSTAIPDHYHQPGSSGITIDITEGENNLKIDLDK